ncbi:helix-turn-helix domain-containing protein [Roseburia intestinalis]
MEVGYNNQTSFRRAFKKKYGVTPSSFGVQS